VAVPNVVAVEAADVPPFLLAAAELATAEKPEES